VCASREVWNPRRLDQLESIILIHNTLHHNRSSPLLWASLLLPLRKNGLLALIIQHLILAFHNALRLLANPFLLRELDQAAKVDRSALVTRAGTPAVEAIEDLGVRGGVGVDHGLDWGVGVVGVLGEELEEGFGEWGGGMVIGIDHCGDFVGCAGGGVVSVWLWVLVCVGLVHDGAPLLHWADLVLWEGELLLGAVEFRGEGDLGAGQGAVTVAPFLGVFLLPLEWEGV